MQLSLGCSLQGSRGAHSCCAAWPDACSAKGDAETLLYFEAGRPGQQKALHSVVLKVSVASIHALHTLSFESYKV
eukprot:1153569-Pelagomonas_calceolata.AAC.1